jgi:hypothetical protein
LQGNAVSFPHCTVCSGLKSGVLMLWGTYFTSVSQYCCPSKSVENVAGNGAAIKNCKCRVWDYEEKAICISNNMSSSEIE